MTAGRFLRAALVVGLAALIASPLGADEPPARIFHIG
jgi:hypothetical protein